MFDAARPRIFFGMRMIAYPKFAQNRLHVLAEAVD